MPAKSREQQPMTLGQLHDAAVNAARMTPAPKAKKAHNPSKNLGKWLHKKVKR